MVGEERQERDSPGDSYLVPAVDQAARILICLGRSSEFKNSLTEICRQVGIHKSKGYSILNTLRQFGLVEKDPRTKAYSLGVGLVSLARNVLDNLDVRDTSGPFLEALAKETGSTALFGLISVDQVFVVAKHQGGRDIAVSIGLGHRFHITSGAHGKAIVAFMPQADRERILAREKLYFYGDADRMDMKRLREELAQCRISGFAWDAGDLQPGINAVSTPVFGLNDQILGCIIIIGTFSQDLIEEYGLKVARAGKEMSIRLGARIDKIYFSLEERGDEWVHLFKCREGDGDLRV